jgi:nucleoside-diphosphate-sugar epimerase
MRILIAGCGYVGAVLAARLADRGQRVFALRRRPRGLPPGVEPVAADLTDPQTLRRLPDGLDLVFYTASANGPDDAAYRRAYVEGVKHLLVGLAASGSCPQCFFFTSSTGVYAQQEGEWVDESSVARPLHFTGRRLLEGEAQVLGGPFPATIVRLGGIYGPGRTQLLDRVRSGQSRYRPGQYTNRIHRDDCAGVLHHLASLERVDPLYLGVDCEPAEQAEVLRWLADRLGAPPPRPDPDAAGSGRRGRSSKRCRNDRLLATGYRFRYPTFREGYGGLLDARE